MDHCSATLNELVTANGFTHINSLANIGKKKLCSISSDGFDVIICQVEFF